MRQHNSDGLHPMLYRFGGSEPVPCHAQSICSDGVSHGTGMDGVIAILWTDLDPAATTDCPQTNQCTGGGNVYYQVNADHMVRVIMYWHFHPSFVRFGNFLARRS